MSVRIERFVYVMQVCFRPLGSPLGKVMAIVMYFCFCFISTLQDTLERGQEARTVQIDFSAAFDGVNHQGILGISALWLLEVLSVCSHSFSLISHCMYIVVNGCQGKLFNVVCCASRKGFGHNVAPSADRFPILLNKVNVMVTLTTKIFKNTGRLF